MSNSEPIGHAKPANSRKVTADILLTVALIVVGMVAIRSLVVQPFTIPSGSMEPNLFQGDYIVVSKFSYGFSRYSFPLAPSWFSGRLFDRAPQRGDIVVFKLPRDPSMDFIKRVIGLPGDHVQLKSGVVFINGQPMARRREPDGVTDMGEGEVPVERFEEINPEGRAYQINALEQNQSAENTGIYVVPPRCYFLLGDNRDNSIDSRFDPNMTFNDVGPDNCGWDPALDTSVPDEPGVGFVPEEELEGRAQMVLFSTSRPDRLMHVLK